jgi:hypothetical protein
VASPGGSDQFQRSRGSSDEFQRARGLGRDDASSSNGGGAKRLPKAVTPRTTFPCAAPSRTDQGANRMRTPRAPGAGVCIAESGSGYTVSPRRSWG